MPIKVNANDLRLDAAGAVVANNGGLKVNLTGSSLEINTNGLRIATGAAGDGLTGGGAAALSVQPKASSGIEADSNGIAIKLGQGVLIDGSNQLAAKVKGTSGIALDGDGLAFAAGNGLTNGATVAVTAHNGIAVSASGVAAVAKNQGGLAVDAQGISAVAGDGISVAGDISVNEGYGFTWTAAHTYSGVVPNSTIDPSNGNDLTRKSYVDTAIDVAKNEFDVKQSVVVATTANLAASYNNGSSGQGATLTATGNGAFPAVDGFTLNQVGQRILVKDQTTGAQNGIYQLSTVGDGGNAWVLTRTTDSDTPAEMHTGNFMFVEGGQTLGGAQFVLTTTGPINIGTTAVTYSQYGQGAQISAGDGLDDTGGTFSIDLDGTTGLVVTASGLKLDLATSGSGRLELNGNNRVRLKLGDDGLPVTFKQVDIDANSFTLSNGNSVFTLSGQEVMTGTNSLGFIRLFKSGVDVMSYDASVNASNEFKIDSAANSVLTINGDIRSSGDVYRLYYCVAAA